MVELMSADGGQLAFKPRQIEIKDDFVRFRIEGLRERPAFARVHYSGGNQSALAVVIVLDLLRDEIRDPRTKRLEIALEELDGDTEVGLWLLETLNTIEASETSLKATDRQATRRSAVQKNSNDDEPEPARVLSYFDFIAGRRLRSDNTGVSQASFAGSDVSRVRGFLNRILSLTNDVKGSTDDAHDSAAFDLHDEVGDAEGSLEDGLETGTGPVQPPARALPTNTQLRAARRRADRQDLVNAITDMQFEIREKSDTGELSATDIPRLRAVLTILATAGWDGRSKSLSGWQILPPAGDKEGSWPRLMGKALSAFFGGRIPAVRGLRIDAEFERIPDDVLECWAMCLWSVNAVCVAAAHGEPQQYRNIAGRLGDSVYALTGLRRKEFGAPVITSLMEAMSGRFAARLGLSPADLAKDHSKAVAARP